MAKNIIADLTESQLPSLAHLFMPEQIIFEANCQIQKFDHSNSFRTTTTTTKFGSDLEVPVTCDNQAVVQKLINQS